MTALEAPRKLRMPVLRCPYCVEGGNFKLMIGPEGGGALVHVRLMRTSDLAGQSVL